MGIERSSGRSGYGTGLKISAAQQLRQLPGYKRLTQRIDAMPACDPQETWGNRWLARRIPTASINVRRFIRSLLLS
jgi:hypothetical protein